MHLLGLPLVVVVAVQPLLAISILEAERELPYGVEGGKGVALCIRREAPHLPVGQLSQTLITRDTSGYALHLVTVAVTHLHNQRGGCRGVNPHRG